MPHLLVTSAQLGHLLQSARKSRGMSQTQAAALLGVSQSRLSKLEQDPGSATVDQLLALCSGLGLEVILQPRTPPASSAPTSSEW